MSTAMTDPMPNLKVTQQRNFSAHHTLLRIARTAITEETTNGSDDQFLAIALSAFAIEPLCNAVGERIVVDWPDFERAPPIAKVRTICDQLSIKFDRNTEPWSSLVWLCWLRNQLAHAKPELIETEETLPASVYNELSHEPPLGRLEKQVTSGNAKRAVNTVDAVLNLFCSKMTEEKKFGLYSDSWVGGATIEDDS